MRGDHRCESPRRRTVSQHGDQPYRSVIGAWGHTGVTARRIQIHLAVRRAQIIACNAEIAICVSGHVVETVRRSGAGVEVGSSRNARKQRQRLAVKSCRVGTHAHHPAQPIDVFFIRMPPTPAESRMRRDDRHSAGIFLDFICVVAARALGSIINLGLIHDFRSI